MTAHSNPTIPKVRSLRRVLAIDPTHRGFGFAVLEGPDRLVDWGVAYARGSDRAECLKRIDRLIMIHQPRVLVVEDVNATRRGTRVRRLIGALSEPTRWQRVPIVAVTKARIRRVLSLPASATKHDVAGAIAESFPELKPILPGKRKCFSSEDERILVFQAIASARSVTNAGEHINLRISN